MKISRREFLRNTTMVFIASLLPIGLNGWIGGLNNLAFGDEINPKRKRLIVLFQRGAVDGLSVVVPYSDRHYYDARPTIAIPSSSSQDSVLDLDGRFGLHPALAPVMPLWKDRSMAFIHACGSPDPTRSHFDAQNFMENGTPGIATTADGWMNRLLSVLPGPHTPTQAVSFGPVLPQIFRGKVSVANIMLGKNSANPMAVDRPAVNRAFDQLYNGDDALSKAYREGRTARTQLLTDLKEEMKMADNGAPSPAGFPDNTERLAKLIAQDPSIQLAFLDLGGWDTHVNQGASKGQLANHLLPLGQGLSNLVKGLGNTYQDTIILVMSEFGRTVHENGNGGTDHGHGNVLWIFGGNIQGGKIYGEWPGLATSDLYEGRDLAITTDFRSAIGLVLRDHFDLDDSQLSQIFPNIPEIPSTLNRMIK